MSELTTADKVAAYLGTGLVVLGVLVMGLLEMLLGAGHSIDEEGQITHEALFPPEIRAYVIIAGLLIWAAYAIYKLVATTPTPATAESA